MHSFKLFSENFCKCSYGWSKINQFDLRVKSCNLVDFVRIFRFVISNTSNFLINVFYCRHFAGINKSNLDYKTNYSCDNPQKTDLQKTTERWVSDFYIIYLLRVLLIIWLIFYLHKTGKKLDSRMTNEIQIFLSLQWNFINSYPSRGYDRELESAFVFDFVGAKMCLNLLLQTGVQNSYSYNLQYMKIKISLISSIIFEKKIRHTHPLYASGVFIALFWGERVSENFQHFWAFYCS